MPFYEWFFCLYITLVYEYIFAILKLQIGGGIFRIEERSKTLDRILKPTVSDSVHNLRGFWGDYWDSLF